MIDRARRFVADGLARDPVFAAAIAVAWVASLVAIWGPREVPLDGWYEQLAQAQLWRHFDDWSVGRFYALARAPVPGWATVGVIRALATVFPVEAAGRIWLSAYALALPLGAARLAQAFGRSRWLALFSFVLVWNVPLASWRSSFAAGLVVLTFALAELESFARRPCRPRAVAVVALGLLLWLTDAAAWGFFVLAAPLLCARRPLAIALVAPSLLLALVGARTMPWSMASIASPPPLARMGEVSASLVMTFGDRAYEMLLILVGVWLILLLGARTDEADTPARGYQLEALALLALVLALALPADLHRPIELHGLASRFWPLCALLLGLVPHGPLDGRRRLLLVPVMVVAVAYPVYLAASTAPLDPPLRGARRLAVRIEPGSSTLTLIDRPEAPGPPPPRVRSLVWAHALPVLAAGGFDAGLPAGFPLRVVHALPAPGERIDPDALAGWDYLLTFDERMPYERLGPDAQARFPLDGTDGSWRLYRRRR
jgi:hypothetical protein